MMRYFSILLISLLFCFNVNCKKKIPRETEPNNSFSTANTMEINSSIEGFIDSIDDKDYFRINIDEPAILDIDLSAVKGINIAFKVWRVDEKPELLKYVDDSRKSSPERMCNLYVYKGTYYICVMLGDKDTPASNKFNPYKLTISSRAYASNEEKEPNDTALTATLIGLGAEITGYYSPAFNKLNTKDNLLREEDWFSFDIAANPDKPVLLDVTLSGVPGVNSVLYVYNSEMKEVASSDSGGTGEGESLKGIGIMNPGRYYIMITTKSFQSNCNDPYKLTVNKRDYDNSQEMEPNNSFEKANQIRNNEISGKIFPSGDRDFFIHKGKGAPMLYKIELIPPANLDMVMNLYNSERKKIFEIDSAGIGEKEIMPDAFFTGDFFIEISSKKGGFNEEISYKLLIAETPYSNNFEIEPNDTKESATKITGNNITGYISKKRDIDYYYIESDIKTKKRFKVKGIKGADIKFSITDQLGYILRTEIIKGNAIKTVREMIDNKCYIIIESITDNYEAPYEINIMEDK